MIQSGYEKVKIIGVGHFGVVWKCINNQNGQVFALKKLNIEHQFLNGIDREILILSELPSHERLLKFYGSTIDEQSQSMLIFIEFVEKGSLRNAINKNGVFSQTIAAKYTKGTLEGLEFLHQHNIIHRDIKCANILLDNHDEVKLADFGLSKLVENKSAATNHTICGTMNFMAPEIIDNSAYNSSVDIWALGVTVVEMLTGYPIYHKLSPMSFIAKLSSRKPIETGIDNLSDELDYFFKLTFIKNPANRPKPCDLLRCKFILKNEIL